MIDAALLSAILDSLPHPVVYVDTQHIIRYMNSRAKTHYSEGERLIGRSLLDCHTAQSQETIRQVVSALDSGVEEHLIADNHKHRIYMRAVRGPDGRLLGYYERFEPPRRPD